MSAFAVIVEPAGALVLPRGAGVVGAPSVEVGYADRIVLADPESRQGGGLVGADERATVPRAPRRIVAGGARRALRAASMTPLAQVLNDVEEFVAEFVVVSDVQRVAITLWVAHTYAVDAADITPYLSITARRSKPGNHSMDVLEGAIVKDPLRAV